MLAASNHYLIESIPVRPGAGVYVFDGELVELKDVRNAHVLELQFGCQIRDIVKLLDAVLGFDPGLVCWIAQQRGVLIGQGAAIRLTVALCRVRCHFTSHGIVFDFGGPVGPICAFFIRRAHPDEPLRSEHQNLSLELFIGIHGRCPSLFKCYPRSDRTATATNYSMGRDALQSQSLDLVRGLDAAAMRPLRGLRGAQKHSSGVKPTDELRAARGYG